MKVFEKWNTEYLKLTDKLYMRHTNSGFQDRYDAWRAALEWTLDMARTNEIHDAKVNIWEEIRNELKN